MAALPGDRQQFPELRYKAEDAATIQLRQNAWENSKNERGIGTHFGNAYAYDGPNRWI